MLHLYNLGFAEAAAVISPFGENVRSINNIPHKTSEIDFVQYMLTNLKHVDTQGLKDVLNAYINEE